MSKTSNFYQFIKKEISSLSLILAIFASLGGPWASVQPLFAQQKVDDSDESAAPGTRGQNGPGDATDELAAKRITPLYIIREDYDGLNLSYPSKLFVDHVTKEIYITDTGHGRILVYTYDFYPLLSIDKSDGIKAPVGLAVDPEGYVFIAESSGRKDSRARISLFNPCLRWKGDIFFSGFENAEGFRPQNIAINKAGRLYVAGSGYPGVVVLKEDGTFSHLLSPADALGKGSEQKAPICDVEIDGTGKIYLLSQEMGRIYVYDDKENFLFKFGKKGGGSGKLSRPRGMAVDDLNKRIYVIDYMRHTASAYSTEGRFLFEFGGKGWARGWFQYPSDISVDTSGNVLVADTFNHRVQVLNIE
jgi:sugar lactone lactonase YvrE